MVYLISIPLLIIYSFFLLYIFGRKGKDVLTEYVYVDRSGITSNPPVNFIDVWKNKTINFKMDDFSISIPHLPILICLNYMENLQNAFAYMKENIKSDQDENKIDSDTKYLQAYNYACSVIYKISIEFIKKKRRKFSKVFAKKCMESPAFMIDICEQVLDYWSTLKKKVQILGTGQTLQKMGGGRFTWNTVNLDEQGKILIKPRYGKPLNTSMN